MPPGANGLEQLRDKKVFTTGQAAKLCNVSQQTIIRCFDSGRLTGFRVPGSRFRRIPRVDLIEFMKTNGIPTDSLEGSKIRVLVVDDDPEIVDLLSDALTLNDRFEVAAASTGYDAGMLTQSFLPHVILLDYLLPDINGNLVCQRVRENPELSAIRIIVVSGVIKQDEVDALLGSGADDFISKPFDIQDLIGRIEELAAR
jgi:two-component system, OmpR family, response regulator RpaA